MNGISVIATQNCLQSGFRSIQHKVYAVQDKLCGLCSTDTKVYAFLVLGRLIQAAAIIGGSVAASFAVFSIPIAIAGVIAAVALGILGTQIAGDPEKINDLLQMARPFVEGQPVGLRNGANDCWLNSSLQLLAHIPSFNARMRLIPEFAQYLDAYAASRTIRETISSTYDPQIIRNYLSAQVGADQIETGAIQHDAAQVFEFLFEGRNALYQLEQQIAGVASPNQIEPMLRVTLGDASRPNFQQLFNSRFDYQDDLSRRVQQFFPQPPNGLLIQAGRFVQRNDSITGRFLGLSKINDLLDVPERLEVSNAIVRTNQAASYACDAFLVHNGTSPNSGHYVSFLKIENMWWCVDDTRVFEVADSRALNAMKHGYIFHYARA